MIGGLDNISVTQLLEGIRKGDRMLIARAITLTESASPQHREKAIALLEACYPESGGAWRIGITGTPGAGKSTFIESFGMHLVQQGRKLAVLAIDPSSRMSKGSILGDKTRMQELAKHPDVFIRPTASGDYAGGVASATREAIIILEAAGFDTIFVETVGVGQSETAVFDITDLFVLLLIPGAGDELQGIKRGIMELADIILINKADGGNIDRAKLAAAEVSRAVHLFQPKSSAWVTKVQTCSALERSNLDQIWADIQAYFTQINKSGHLQENRRIQHRQWFRDQLQDALLRYLQLHPAYREQLATFEAGIQNGTLLPPAAVADLLKKLLPS